MKKIKLKFKLIAILILLFALQSFTQSNFTGSDNLKVVFLRHGEKPEKGGNLTCKGLNRSLMLPEVIYSKFGIPNYIYVPKMDEDITTKHARMFETVIPLAVKYNLAITSKYEEQDSSEIAEDIKQKKGIVLVVWEHKAMSGIVHSLGIANPLKWTDDDYNSIWIVTFKDGKVVLTTDKEGLNPAEDCK